MHDPVTVLLRLIGALALGAAVAWIHARTTKSAEMGASFPSTLVLLAVLIAMVTQVIGDNVARAFSLVGALSIVRFRTVVRDTRDTAFVIFAVVVGMAAGAENLPVAVLGLAVGGIAAFTLSALARSKGSEEWVPTHVLRVRSAVAVNLEGAVDGVLDKHAVRRRLVSLGTVKLSTAMEAMWEIDPVPVEELVRVIGRIEGIQDVRIERRGSEEK
jgi:hypothetical protein